jgi:hypothetical protein
MREKEKLWKTPHGQPVTVYPDGHNDGMLFLGKRSAIDRGFRYSCIIAGIIRASVCSPWRIRTGVYAAFIFKKSRMRAGKYFLCLFNIYFRRRRRMDAKLLKIVLLPILPIKKVKIIFVWIQLLINCLTYGNIISFNFLLTKHTLL